MLQAALTSRDSELQRPCEASLFVTAVLHQKAEHYCPSRLCTPATCWHEAQAGQLSLSKLAESDSREGKRAIAGA